MEVELLYIDGCPHWRTAAERVRQVVAELGGTVRHSEVTPANLHEMTGFAGSPTILVDRCDLFPLPLPALASTAAPSVGLSCRLYATPSGPAGAPTVDQLRAALAPVRDAASHRR